MFHQSTENCIRKIPEYLAAGLSGDEAGELLNLEGALLNGATLVPIEEARMVTIKAKLVRLLDEQK